MLVWYHFFSFFVSITCVYVMIVLISRVHIFEDFFDLCINYVYHVLQKSARTHHMLNIFFIIITINNRVIIENLNEANGIKIMNYEYCMIWIYYHMKTASRLLDAQ